MHVHLITGATWLMAMCAAEERHEKVTKQVNDADIVLAANVGQFHINTFLQLELASPHYKSRLATESFSVVVMKSTIDDVLSFAIDTFPVMDEAAIETFWIDMVERKRAARDAVFANWASEHHPHPLPLTGQSSSSHSKDEL
ncbi:hypothetical protein DYB25_001354 [Aphanomyces astaci]|uniref:Uncharacterized protein n=1 Tax=Aphanomyces astaci TaxID=112090 RepID=A0A397C365_APHAT|nr:hypothetical protein DYB36_007127 [Aphanomyces astaci]RHY35928.1 hypothetical protein DYB38_001241 [Aphanomyces astaci]RHY36674.1 hypothetical protein DYB25_001354 [Aphanomyces astaci]RHY37448.1 hypothetical protein DYB34_007700 [Aphanomyces astaci]RHZ03987.1 hypothetical protein DYB26_006211 [Aphanomyces astaci]